MSDGNTNHWVRVAGERTPRRLSGDRAAHLLVSGAWRYMHAIVCAESWCRVRRRVGCHAATMVPARSVWCGVIVPVGLERYIVVAPKGYAEPSTAQSTCDPAAVTTQR